MRESINDTSNRPLAFLASPHAARILSIPQLLTSPVPILPKPSSQASTDFESRTAAINVTSSPGAPYSLDEIKEDSSWLSRRLDLDEIECLRIALLEWQTRPIAQLRDGLSETEAASLRDALGSEDYGLGRSDTPGPGGLQILHSNLGNNGGQGWLLCVCKNKEVCFASQPYSRTSSCS